jgi:hypothetical protein
VAENSTFSEDEQVDLADQFITEVQTVVNSFTRLIRNAKKVKTKEQREDIRYRLREMGFSDEYSENVTYMALHPLFLTLVSPTMNAMGDFELGRKIEGKCDEAR